MVLGGGCDLDRWGGFKVSLGFLQDCLRFGFGVVLVLVVA